MGFLKLSEVTPIPGVTSDTETGLVSPLLPVDLFCTKICNLLPLNTVVQMQKLQVKQLIERHTIKANISNPSEVTPVDGIHRKKNF